MPPYQTSISQHYNVRPFTSITDGSPVEFLTSNGGSDYIDLGRTRLHVTLRVTHEDGSMLTDKEHVGPVNLFKQSLWSQVAVYLQGQLVSSNNGGYPYKAFIQTLLGYGAEAKDNQLQSQLFNKDKGETTADFDSKDPLGGGNVPQFALMSGAPGTEYKIELQDVYLKVYKLKMDNALVLVHAKQFENTNALYPYMKTDIPQASISASQMTYTFDNLFLDQCPSRLVGFVSGEGVNGSYTKHTFNFQGSNIKTVGLYLDGVSVPGRPVEADDIETYVNLFEATNIWREDKGNFIQKQSFSLSTPYSSSN
ncbi:uncharacterized protein LOC125381066 [Haliotis rufescens]|uniref:uncharacterized protein LOC125381066 n=1 Tax=Haliotis rufescens TaxID=6454 RepID=UPI00201EF9F4|nr:uncharacterized protein LOC125381066 [Haliotis rufescens]